MTIHPVLKYPIKPAIEMPLRRSQQIMGLTMLDDYVYYLHENDSIWSSQ